MKADMEAPDGTSDTNRASFAGYATARRGCAEGGSTARGHSNNRQSADNHCGHKNWPKWLVQFTACMGCANPKSIEAPRWAAKEEHQITAAAVNTRSFEDHNPQPSAVLCLGTAVQRKRLVTVKNTEVKSGLEAWCGLNSPRTTATTKVANEYG